MESIKMKKQISIVAILVVIASWGLASRVSAEIPLTLGAGFAEWNFDGERDLDGTTTPWVSFELALSDNWAAEFMYAEDETNIKNGADVDVATWNLNMLYYGGSFLDESNRIRPYILLGGGEIDIDAGAYDTVETTLNLGAGLRWMMSGRIGMRVEARAMRSLDESKNDTLVSVGFNYYFGKVKADVVEVVAAAAPAPLDSDGDGVTDDRDRCPGTKAGTRVDADGCPLPVARVASIKLKVNFAFDSAEVEERYFTDISELGAFLQRFEDLYVDVEGHTDSAGPETYNQKLSQRRAQAVVDLLVNQHGIPASRLRATGFGESRPVESNDTSEGRRENRRVMATLEVEYEE